MAVLLREVFIASNFAEFEALRTELKQRIDAAGFARAIDLNDNAPDPRSPWKRSRGRIRSSDLVVLLVGQQYGQTRADGKLSYTHLEYREARSEGIPILPYMIGPGYSQRPTRPQPGAANLHPLQREVLDEHVSTFHESDTDPAQLADAILDAVRDALLGPRGDAENGEESDDLELIDRSSFGTGDLEALERGRSGDDLSSEFELLRRPAEVAAAEQLREARRALEALDRKSTIHHLRRALELRPLDPVAGYDLARLLLTSRHKDLREASRLAQRVARVAVLDGNEVRQGFALSLAATAEGSLGNDERALAFARAAVKAADRVAAVHIECAFVYAKLGQLEHATQEAQRAFVLHPASFWKLSRDRVLGRSAPFQALASKLLTETRDSVIKILALEQDAALLAQRVLPDAPGDETKCALAALETVPKLDLVKAVACGKESARRSLQLLRKVAQRLPAAASATDGLRADASRLVSERQSVVAQPVLPLDPALFDNAALWAPILLAIALCFVGGLELYAIALTVLFGLAAGFFLRRTLRERKRRHKVQQELSQLETRLSTADDLARRAEQDLKRALADFANLVEQLERHAVAPTGGRFSPSIGTARAAIGKLVRIRPSAPPEHFVLDTELFPTNSGADASDSARPSHKHQLFMVTGREKGRWLASRWACYFDATERRTAAALRTKLRELGILAGDELAE